MAPASKQRSRPLDAQRRGEALAAALPPLLVAAERVAATVVQGVHGRRRVGLGETFWQFRTYEPGDPPQLIDWRQTAKSDRVYVRDLEWEAAQSLWLWSDGSGSMNWRSVEAAEQKKRRADVLLLALASLLVRGGERVALLGSGRRPHSGRDALQRLALALERNQGAEQEDEGQEDEGLPPRDTLPRHSRVILFSDFLAPVDAIEARLRGFAERGVGGHLVQILDPAELSFPFNGRLNFVGLESENSWLLSRSEAVRGDYLKRMERQRQALADLARRLGWRYQLHRTDRSAESALLSLYQTIGILPTVRGGGH
ncbi:DUF58 domain-containing protein [Aquibaculum sediminis]|uniref:DUF58 domain-containing protein n=1 Tax=Aquibaculum sediminis TaxID=3231907 RepID=UPI003451391B